MPILKRSNPLHQCLDYSRIHNFSWSNILWALGCVELLNAEEAPHTPGWALRQLRLHCIKAVVRGSEDLEPHKPRQSFAEFAQLLNVQPSVTNQSPEERVRWLVDLAYTHGRTLFTNGKLRYLVSFDPTNNNILEPLDLWSLPSDALAQVKLIAESLLEDQFRNEEDRRAERLRWAYGRLRVTAMLLHEGDSPPQFETDPSASANCLPVRGFMAPGPLPFWKFDDGA